MTTSVISGNLPNNINNSVNSVVPDLTLKKDNLNVQQNQIVTSLPQSKPIVATADPSIKLGHQLCAKTLMDNFKIESKDDALTVREFLQNEVAKAIVNEKDQSKSKALQKVLVQVIETDASQSAPVPAAIAGNKALADLWTNGRPFLDEKLSKVLSNGGVKGHEEQIFSVAEPTTPESWPIVLEVLNAWAQSKPFTDLLKTDVELQKTLAAQSANLTANAGKNVKQPKLPAVNIKGFSEHAKPVLVALSNFKGSLKALAKEKAAKYDQGSAKEKAQFIELVKKLRDDLDNINSSLDEMKSFCEAPSTEGCSKKQKSAINSLNDFFKATGKSCKSVKDCLLTYVQNIASQAEIEADNLTAIPAAEPEPEVKTEVQQPEQKKKKSKKKKKANAPTTPAAAIPAPVVQPAITITTPGAAAATQPAAVSTTAATNTVQPVSKRAKKKAAANASANIELTVQQTQRKLAKEYGSALKEYYKDSPSKYGILGSISQLQYSMMQAATSMEMINYLANNIDDNLLISQLVSSLVYDLHSTLEQALCVEHLDKKGSIPPDHHLQNTAMSLNVWDKLKDKTKDTIRQNQEGTLYFRFPNQQTQGRYKALELIYDARNVKSDGYAKLLEDIEELYNDSMLALADTVDYLTEKALTTPKPVDLSKSTLQFARKKNNIPQQLIDLYDHLERYDEPVYKSIYGDAMFQLDHIGSLLQVESSSESVQAKILRDVTLHYQTAIELMFTLQNIKENNNVLKDHHLNFWVNRFAPIRNTNAIMEFNFGDHARYPAQRAKTARISRWIQEIVKARKLANRSEGTVIEKPKPVKNDGFVTVNKKTPAPAPKVKAPIVLDGNIKQEISSNGLQAIDGIMDLLYKPTPTTPTP